MKMKCTKLQLLKWFCLLPVTVLVTMCLKHRQVVNGSTKSRAELAYGIKQPMHAADTRAELANGIKQPMHAADKRVELAYGIKQPMHAADTMQDFRRMSTTLTASIDISTTPMNKDIDAEDKVYQKRRETMLKACSEKKHPSYQGRSYAMHRILFNRKYKLAYCAVEKTGSTFLKNLFPVLSNSTSSKDPFKPGRLTHIIEYLDVARNKKLTDAFMNKSTTIIFTRNPYTRLFSGYVDKLFSPNALFWKSNGRYIVKLFRPNATETALRCGHDLTFREMVKYIIHSEHNKKHQNLHFMPQHRHCKPCHYQYDIIGQFESMNDDIMYILKKFNRSDVIQPLEDGFRNKQVSLTIKDQTGWLFLFRPYYKNCMSFHTAQKRMWKKFQIRGFVSKHSKYPVTFEESEKLTSIQYQHLLAEGIGDAIDNAVGRKNKEEAMIEAYSSVDKDDLEKLRKIFQPDCDLYGYNCRPKNIFEQKRKIKPWYFDINTA